MGKERIRINNLTVKNLHDNNLVFLKKIEYLICEYILNLCRQLLIACGNLKVLYTFALKKEYGGIVESLGVLPYKRNILFL